MTKSHGAKPKTPARRTRRAPGKATARKPETPSPAAARDLRLLALATPPAPAAEGPGVLSAFAGRLVLAGREAIFAADPGARAWEVVHEAAPRVLTREAGALAERLGLVSDGPVAVAMRESLPEAFGFGPFAVFQGASDPAPCLYCATRSAFGGRVLRSADGRRFAAVAGPEAAGPEGAGQAALTLAAAEGWLVAAPAPAPRRDRKKGPLPPEGPVTIRAARDPGGQASGAGDWAEVAPPGLGAGVTGGVSALGVAAGAVHAAIDDPHGGFQLWRAPPRDTLPWAWERVIDRGGWRYSLAPTVTAMVEFGGALYLAAGISASGYGKDRAGPAAAEILRVNADGSWDLIVGQPRFSPDGMKVPLAGRGPGFGDGFNTLVTGFAVAGGVLYAGTRNAAGEYRMRAARAEEAKAAEDAAAAGKTPPQPAKRGTDLPGGCALWATADGESWAPVIEAGGGNPAATAVRGLCAGPAETANGNGNGNGNGGGLYAALAVNPALLAFQAGMPAAPGTQDEIEIWQAPEKIPEKIPEKTPTPPPAKGAG